MDWNDLRYFLTIARTGTLAGAARELRVEHTTVGRRLSALENALGVRLFTRGPGGVLLTAAGAEVLRSAEDIADNVASIERRVSGVDSRISGTVRLTIPESVNDYFARQLARLRACYPELVIELLSDNRALDIRGGEADIAVRFCEASDPDLIVRKAGIGGWSLYASPEYVARKGLLKSPKDLRGHDVIGFQESLADVTGALWLRAHADGARTVLRGNSTAAIASAVVVGLGLAPLPCFLAAQSGIVRLTDI